MTVDWSNTVLYKLRSNNLLINDEYVGKSGDFTARQANHKSKCNNNNNSSEYEYHFKVCVFIRENGGYDDWHFEILETANLEDEKAAATLERYWIETLKPTLNKNLPGLTPEERTEYKRVYNRIRHKKNMEDPEYRKKMYETSKKRREDPELKKKDEANKKEKMTCICGVIHSRNGKSEHLKSLKHKKFVENNQQET